MTFLIFKMYLRTRKILPVTSVLSTETIIIIIIISIFKEDNVFSITASLPYGPPVNTDIDYYRTIFGLVNFCKCCKVSCAIFC